MGDKPGSRWRGQPIGDSAADLQLPQFSKQHFRSQKVVFDEAAERAADPVFVGGNDRRVRNRHSQRMAEEGCHGEPVGKSADHTRLLRSSVAFARESIVSSELIAHPFADLAGPSLVPDVVSSQIANAQDWQLPQTDPKWEILNPAREQADMVPVAYIEHQLPGRVRLRVPSRRGEVPFFEKVVRELSKHPAISELSASPLTGSIMLQYFEPLQPIAAAAADQKLFETRRLEPAAKTEESRQAHRLSQASGLANGLATGLSGLSLFQAMQGKVLGSAVENFWLSFGAHTTLGRPDVATLFASLGIYQMFRGRLFGSASSLLFYALVMRQMAVVEDARARGWGASRSAKAASSGVRIDAGSNAGTGTGLAGSPLGKASSELSS
jgi:hypothetical protein